MARPRMVTRKIMVSKATVLCVDLHTQQTVVNEYTFTGKGEYTRKDLLDQLRDEHETDTIKLVSIQRVSSEERHYGMLEKDFIRLAKEI